MPDTKPTLCLDFDGVIHSYTSGWKGADVIPDPPVPGALQFIIDATEHFHVAIFSSRSNQGGGRMAMRTWLIQSLGQEYGIETPSERLPRKFFDAMKQYPEGTQYEAALGAAMDFVYNEIQFPAEKPPAFVGIDDRVLTFNGTFPSVEELKHFKPWNRGTPLDPYLSKRERWLMEKAFDAGYDLGQVTKSAGFTPLDDWLNDSYRGEPVIDELLREAPRR